MLHWSMAPTLPVCKSVAHFIDISTTNNLTTLQVITFHFYYPFSFVLLPFWTDDDQFLKEISDISNYFTCPHTDS